MASNAVNEAKRDLMSRTVAEVRRRGWTTAQLATVFRVSASTVNSWARGDSMGTNAQRAELANLKSPDEERPRLRQLAAGMREEAAKRDRDAASAAAKEADLVAEMYRGERRRLLARAEAFESI